MVSEKELKSLTAEFRQKGGICRLKIGDDGLIEAVSFGLMPDEDSSKFRALGDLGAGWVPPIQAAERMRAAIAKATT